jgi:hypothetical protein
MRKDERMREIAIIDRGRGPELAGTRITVFDVLHYFDAGLAPFLDSTSSVGWDRQTLSSLTTEARSVEERRFSPGHPRQS